MKALVTGATGFIGGHLVRRLAAEGHEVVALARPTSDTDSIRRFTAEMVRGDLRDSDAVATAARGCDWVFHLAATTTAGGLRSREPDWGVNVEGTASVGAGALRAGVSRFVFTSSIGVYGAIDGSPVDETTPPRPNSPYRRTKLAAEERLLALHREEGLPAVIARVTKVIGRGTKAWLPLCRKIARGPFRMVGNGENRVDAAHVSDIVDGLLRCARAPTAVGGVWVLSGREPVPLGPLLERVAAELGSRLRRVRLPAIPFRLVHGLASWRFRHLGRAGRRPHPYELFLADVVIDAAESRAALGYEPVIGLEEGLLETVHWYRAEGWLPA